MLQEVGRIQDQREVVLPVWISQYDTTIIKYLEINKRLSTYAKQAQGVFPKQSVL